MSLFLCSNLHAEPASTPLLLPHLMFISTPDIDWTPPDFRKQFRSTISAGQPQFLKKYIKHDKCTIFLSVIKLDCQKCQQQNPSYSYLWHSQQMIFSTVYTSIKAKTYIYTSSGLHNIYSQQLTPYLEQALQRMRNGNTQL